VSKSVPLSLKREDFQELADDYPEVERLLQRLNNFGTGVSSSLSRGLTLGENVAAQVADITATPSDDWIAATYQNSWATFAGDPATQYVKLENGLVRMRGRIIGGATGTVAFTIPADFAPDRTIYQSALSSATQPARATIGTTGTVTIDFLGAPTWIAVDGVSFVAADRHPDTNDHTAMKVKLTLPSGRRPKGVTVIRARDVTNKTEEHVGVNPWVDWYDDGGQLVIEHIAGLAPGRTYNLRLLIWGD
jgi:hypothetical protein